MGAFAQPSNMFAVPQGASYTPQFQRQSPTVGPYFGNLGGGGIGELNQQDLEVESWYSVVEHTMKAAVQFLCDSIMKSLNFLTNMYEQLKPAVIHISSSIISFMVSSYVLYRGNNSLFFKMVLGANMLSSFSAFVTSIKCLLGDRYPWSSDAAMAYARRNMLDLDSMFREDDVRRARNGLNPSFRIKANSDEPSSFLSGMDTTKWVKAGLAAVMGLLLAGLGLTKLVDWKELLTKCQLIGTAGRAYQTVSGVADFILQNVVGIETEVDYIAVKELQSLVEEGQELINMSPAHFVQEPVDYDRLCKFSNKIVKATSQPVSRDTSQRYHTTRGLLLQMYRILAEKVSTVRAILETKQRQATVPNLLSGAPGVGKSELCKFLAKQVAAIMGYKPAMYTINKKSDGFYEPYGGQSFGVFNEWMALMSEDPLIRDFNQMFSSDPMNLEGAALECKTQPCRLKLGFLTANTDNPELTRVVNAGAAAGVWDRIYHVRVEDPLCKGRGHPNPHRKPDFSHLRFVQVNHNGLNCTDGPTIDMRIYLNRLVGRVATAEKVFLEYLLDEDQADAATKAEIIARIAELKRLIILNPPYDEAPSVTANAGSR
jgi:hypothetical protein